MNISVSKLLISSTSAASVAGLTAGGYFLFAKNKNETQSAAAIIVTVSTEITTEAGNNSTDGISNYQCRFKSIIDSTSDCNVSVFDTSKAQKQSSLDEIVNNKSTIKLTTSLLRTANKVFKVSVPDDFFVKYSNNKDKKLEIFKKENGSVIAELDVLFGVKSDKTMAGMTKTYVAKAKTFTTTESSTGSPKSVTLESNKVFKCYIGDDGSATSAKACKLFEFASSGTQDNTTQLSTLKFDKSSDAAETKTITEHKHYILTFDDSSSHDLSSPLETNKKLFVHVMQSSSSDQEVTSGVKKIEFDLLIPVVISPDSEPFV